MTVNCDLSFYWEKLKSITQLIQHKRIFEKLPSAVCTQSLQVPNVELNITKQPFLRLIVCEGWSLNLLILKVYPHAMRVNLVIRMCFSISLWLFDNDWYSFVYTFQPNAGHSAMQASVVCMYIQHTVKPYMYLCNHSIHVFCHRVMLILTRLT